MRSLNEELERIKSLFSEKRLYGNIINEYCDLSACSEEEIKNDLENKGWDVQTPLEVETSCKENSLIKNVSDALNDTSIYTSKTYGENKEDCFILFTGKDKEGTTGKYRFHITFYASTQVIISMNLGTNNENKKLLYRGKFNSDGSNVNITNIVYLGVRDGQSAKFENKNYKTTSGGDITGLSSTQISDWGVTDPVNYKTFLNYFLNLYIPDYGNIFITGMDTSRIKKLLQVVT